MPSSPVVNGQRPFPALRLAFVYIALFATTGIALPYLPVWLKSRGLDAEAISLVVAMSAAVKVLANPLVAHVADRRGERQRIMVWLAIGALFAIVAYGPARSFWPLFMVTVAYFSCFSPIMPLTESLTMLTAHARKLDYGRIRLWGSISFIAAAALIGQALTTLTAEVVYWGMLGCTVVIAAACAIAPRTKVPAADPGRFTLWPVLSDRMFLVFLLAATLVQCSHAVYYVFGTLHWLSVGYSPAVIGLLWAEGVVAEVVLFIFGQALVRRFGPLGLLALGGVAGVVRWTVTGLTDALPALVIAQALHAFTFGAAHLGAIHFIAQHVSPALSATAQSLYSALVMGLGLGLAILAAGSLYDAWEGAAYLPMAVLCLLGAWIAMRLARALTARPRSLMSPR